MFGIFHDAGYKGLCGGLGRGAIKERKGIPQKDQIMDRMDTTELAANQFRMTQTRDKLARERVKDQQRRFERMNRSARKCERPSSASVEPRLRTSLPPNISERIKSAPPKLELDEKDAKGLIGPKDEE